MALPRELANEGVRVNAIQPGMVDTENPMPAVRATPDVWNASGQAFPCSGIGSAEEIADATLYLLSEASSYVTGSILRVSGGR